MSCIVITNDATELRSTLKYLNPYVLLYKLNTDEYEVVLDSTDTYDKGEVINWDCIDDLDLHLEGRDELEEKEEGINPIGEGLRQREDQINIGRWQVMEFEMGDENVPEENN